MFPMVSAKPLGLIVQGFVLPNVVLAILHCREPVNLFGAYLSWEGNCLSRLEGRGGSHLLKTIWAFGRVGGENETEQRGGGWELAHSCSCLHLVSQELLLSNASLTSWRHELVLVPPSGNEGRQALKLLKCLENLQRDAWHKCTILMKTAWAWLNSDDSNKTSIWELMTIVPKKETGQPCTLLDASL